jgi:hypothetical protein
MTDPKFIKKWKTMILDAKKQYDPKRFSSPQAQWKWEAEQKQRENEKKWLKAKAEKERNQSYDSGEFYD